MHCDIVPLNNVILVYQVFGALSQLECGSEVWERVLFQSYELLMDSNDEPLAATIDFIFKAASQCQHLPEAVCIHCFEILSRFFLMMWHCFFFFL